MLPRIDKGERILQVLVRDNNVDQALRVLKKKMQREGLFREFKARTSYEKPSEKRAREGGSRTPPAQAAAQEASARRPAAGTQARCKVALIALRSRIAVTAK